MRLMIASSSTQAEEARLWIARLRQGRDRADLDVAEAERGQSADGAGVLVVARRKPDGILELSAQRPLTGVDGAAYRRLSNPRAGGMSSSDAQHRSQCQRVRLFRVQA